LVYEQVIFSRVEARFLVNTTIPLPGTDHVFLQPGFGMDDGAQSATADRSPMRSSAMPTANFLTTGIGTSAVAVSGGGAGRNGSPSLVQSGTAELCHYADGVRCGRPHPQFPQGNTRAKRLTWIQKR